MYISENCSVASWFARESGIAASSVQQNKRPIEAYRPRNQWTLGKSSRSACQKARMITPDASSALASPVAVSSAGFLTHRPRLFLTHCPSPKWSAVNSSSTMVAIFACSISGTSPRSNRTAASTSSTAGGLC